MVLVDCSHNKRAEKSCPVLAGLAMQINNALPQDQTPFILVCFKNLSVDSVPSQSLTLT
jgi:hypothetical protein